MLFCITLLPAGNLREPEMKCKRQDYGFSVKKKIKCLELARVFYLKKNIFYNVSFHGESRVICFNQSYLTSSLSASCIRAIAFSCFSSIFFSPIFLNIMSVLNMYFFPDLVLDFGEMKQLHSYIIINFLLHARYSQKFQITYKSCSPSCSLW